MRAGRHKPAEWVEPKSRSEARVELAEQMATYDTFGRESYDGRCSCCRRKRDAEAWECLGANYPEFTGWGWLYCADCTPGIIHRLGLREPWPVGPPA